MTKVFYSVHKGHVPGIYSTWKECEKQIHKFEGAIFKKFENEEDAKKFMEAGFGDKKPNFLAKKENSDKKNKKKIEDECDGVDEDSKIYIYTDGSFIKNKSGDKAGYGIYIPSKNLSISAPLLNQKLTNNRAEMTAIIESFKYLDEEDFEKKICIFTDSQYSIYIFGDTGERYEKNNFINEGKQVPNIDLIKKALELKRKHKFVLLKVRAHTGEKDIHSKNNEIVDKLAVSGALSGESSPSASEHLDTFVSAPEKCEGVKKYKSTKLTSWFT